MIRVAYLLAEKGSLSTEEEAAWNWLTKQPTIKAQSVTTRQILAQPSVLRQIDVLWWHFDSAIERPEVVKDPEAREILTDFSRKGGSIFLSLLAVPYVVDLGVESTMPNFIRKGEWEFESWVKDYPDIRGMGSNQGHPIFDNLSGAVYTWNPQKGSPYAAAFYQAPDYSTAGHVVAVERQYIKLNEDWRLITEYDFGKGKILTVGSYLYFSAEGNRFRLHLEKFALNCLQYLSAPGKARTERTYWSFTPRTVSEESRSSRPIKFGRHSTAEKEDGLSIVRDPEHVSNSYFGVSGRRLLMMGKEQTGLQEVWCHPFRLARNLRTGFRIAGGELQWFDQRKPHVTVRPEAVTRVYTEGEMRIEETIASSVLNPGGSVSYHINTNHPIDLIVTAQVDLRIMWPHSENATGSLVHAWDPGLQAFAVRNDAGRLVSILGTTAKPERMLAGRLKDISFHNENLEGTTNEAIEVGLAFHFMVRQQRLDFSILLAGSDQGEAEATRVYRSLAEHPRAPQEEQARHVRSLFERSTMIDSPDPVFNEGYRWALIATDRFLVTTPSLGTSLMAGFGTTERGWDGGQTVSGRPGYAWYFGRDACWTAFAMLDYGDFVGVRDVLEFLGRHQDLNGKILHELTSSGHVHYDSADATPLYCILMGRYVRMSGDTKFARQEYPRLSNAIGFCFSTDTDRDHLIENTNVGHGWVEGGKLFPVHTEIYLAACWKSALEEGAAVAKMLGKTADSAKWRREAQTVAGIVRKDFWNEETGFYDFGKYANGKRNEERTILSAVAIYFGCTDAQRAGACLREYATSDFTADWGVRIVRKSNPMFNPGGYHQGSVWPLFTGWAALAEFRSGRGLQGYMHAVSTMMGYQSGAAGYIEEVLHGNTFKPAGVCSHQAWSESMILQPLLEGIAGVVADPESGVIEWNPWIPPHWTNLRISNIITGRGKLQFSMERADQSILVNLRRDKGKTLDLLLGLPRWHGTEFIDVRVTPSRSLIGQKSDIPNGKLALKIGGAVEIRARVKFGLALVPPRTALADGEQSSGVKIIEERFQNSKYEIGLEGITGREYVLLIVDPAGLIRSVENGAIRKREGEIVEIQVSFPSGEGSKYVSKLVTLTV